MIHKHFKTREKFDQEFFKLPSSISDNDICFIKDTGEIWTHGRFYAQTDDVLESLEDLEDQSEVIAAAIVDLNESFGDLGKVFLKENIVNGTNVLTQEMLNSTDTIYSIAYDYVCNSNITIPSNCVLEFNGGSISGGTITLQNTKLDGDVKFSGTTISGSCTNDLLTPQMFGAYPTLTETESNKTQHTLAFRNLVSVVNNPNTLTKTIYVPGGHYAINNSIRFSVSCKFYGDGDSTVIDLYDGSGTIIFGEPSRNSTSTFNILTDKTITADAHKLDRKIVVNNTTGLNVGDHLILIDTKNGSFNNSRPYHRTCECIRIKKIIDNNIYIDDILYGDYFADFGDDYETSFDPAPLYRTVITKFTPCVFNISDFRVLSHAHQNADPAAYYSLTIRGFENSKITNITVENYGNDVAANISIGINFEIDHCTIRSFTSYVGDAYGLALSMSQNFRASNSTFRANSHALCTTADGSYFSLQNRNFIYDNLHFETSEKINYDLDNEYTFIDLDVHASAEYYKIINTIAPQTSCDTGGYNVTIEGCKFYSITPTFNMGDFTIRSCELFGLTDNMLFSNINRENENGKNSIIIESCIFHRHVGINVQDKTFLRPFEYLIIRNNTFHNELRVKYAYFRHITIENNYSIFGPFFSGAGELKADTVSIKNNVLQDGYLYMAFTGKVTEGIVSNNTIIRTTPPTGGNSIKYTLGLHSFRGNICQNLIVSYVEEDKNSGNAALIHITDNCEVNVFDNILRRASGTLAGPILRNGDYSDVSFKRNIHNSLRSSPIEESPYGYSGKSQSTADKYSDLISEDSTVYKKLKVDFSNVGDFIFERSRNKYFYLANKPKLYALEGETSATLVRMLLSNDSGGTNCFAGQEGCVPNTLEYGVSYLIYINNSGAEDHNLYFSKRNPLTDEEFDAETDLYTCLTWMTTKIYYSFTAPDPTVYHYIYCTTGAVTSHTYTIYKNQKFCEYDGAVRDVKRIGTTSERPDRNQIYQGFKYWDTDLQKEIIAEELSNAYVYWRETDGAIAGVKRIGTTSERPSGQYKPYSSGAWRPNIYVGFRYYDTTINAEIYASEISNATVTWKELDGASAGVKRIGTTSERPNGENIYVGFRYIDTTIGKEVYASAISGSTVTWIELGGSQIEYQYN